MLSISASWFAQCHGALPPDVWKPPMRARNVYLRLVYHLLCPRWCYRPPLQHTKMSPISPWLLISYQSFSTFNGPRNRRCKYPSFSCPPVCAEQPISSMPVLHLFISSLFHLRSSLYSTHPNCKSWHIWPTDFPNSTYFSSVAREFVLYFRLNSCHKSRASTLGECPLAAPALPSHPQGGSCLSRVSWRSILSVSHLPSLIQQGLLISWLVLFCLF